MRIHVEGCSKTSKEEAKGKKISTEKLLEKRSEEWREEDRERDMLGRLNVVWGYGVIKTSCLGSFSVLVRAADTNSRGIKYKP